MLFSFTFEGIRSSRFTTIGDAMRRQDFIEIVYANGMRRSVKRQSSIPSPLAADLMYHMNKHGHRVVEIAE
jgi:hypothetical protein